MMKVSCRLADGSQLDWVAKPDVLQRLRQLQASGCAGKALVDRLLTDDWGPPPVTVTISGQDEEGKRVNVVLDYD